MKLARRKTRLALLAVVGISVTVFCMEVLSYHYNRSKWPVFNRHEDVAMRILYVADPQIIGEKDENFYLGGIIRWDADRYLRVNYRLAKSHLSPDVIVFLGDLFDEGSTASDPEYRRYFTRFTSIFDLPTNANPSTIKHIFVPGDNDVGGEKPEPVDEVKVDWFNKTFGNLRSVTDVAKSGIQVQFVKMNLFMPTEYKNPLKGFENVINGTNQPDVRLLVSHLSLLSYRTKSVEEVLENFNPSLIISAHSHKSEYLRFPKRHGHSTYIEKDFLLPGASQKTPLPTSETPRLEKVSSKMSFQIDLKKENNEFHEILVPTCSYRMGVNEMGYGAMELYKNGTVAYTVLWLPSRFNQLMYYFIIYVAMKIILTPFICCKVGTYLYSNFWRNRKNSTHGHILKP